MTRMLRIHSESGYMHVMVRGNGRQILFEDKTDYLYFLNLLRRFSKETAITICAYCLMENHVHLLICDKEQHMSLFMQKLSLAYTYYFNRKYEHCGHLFQGRYTSKAIESEDYLLTVFRYILTNPRESGISEPSDYPWSSYMEYGNSASFVDTGIFQDMLGSLNEYEKYIAAKYEDDPEMKPIKRDDEWAKGIIRNCLNIESGTVLQSYDWKTRNEAIRILKEKGLSIRQIERLTGINRNAIQRA